MDGLLNMMGMKQDVSLQLVLKSYVEIMNPADPDDPPPAPHAVDRQPAGLGPRPARGGPGAVPHSRAHGVDLRLDAGGPGSAGGALPGARRRRADP